MRTSGPIAWGNFSNPFLDDLARFVAGRRVLEVFAGNGLLARELSSRGADIRATSLLSGIDGHADGMFFEVEEVEASAAVALHGDWADVLLMSWAPATEAAARCVARFGGGKDIVFIGEITRPELGMGGLGGCGSDRLFQATRVTSRFGTYEGRGHLDVAVVLRLLD
jgi:hypothetical protein